MIYIIISSIYNSKSFIKFIILNSVFYNFYILKYLINIKTFKIKTKDKIEYLELFFF